MNLCPNKLISLSLSLSSAKRFSLEEITDCKSFMCSRNRIGPKTVPYGTPESTVTRSDCIPSQTCQALVIYTTYCCNETTLTL